MIAWKQHLAGYEWLIHQVWYLEVEPGEVIEPKPHLIPNPRAHLLLTPQQQPYVYDSGETLLSGKGSHLLAASEHLLLLDDNPPIKRIGITFRPEGLFILQHAINVVQPVSAINQCQMMTELGFTELDAHKVSADCYAENVGSYKTLEKCGFVQEGRQKDYYKLEHGFDDKLYYGITAEQFSALNR